MPNHILFEGQKFGLLTAGPLVFDVENHPQYLTTPRSYITHGRLRECTCQCGQIVLYSENALQVGLVKSCGCLKRARRERQHTEKVQKSELKALKMDIAFLIKKAQFRLKTIQTTPTHIRSPLINQEESWLAERLRKLFALKGYANRKVVPLDTLSTKVRELKESYFVG